MKNTASLYETSSSGIPPGTVFRPPGKRLNGRSGSPSLGRVMYAMDVIDKLTAQLSAGKAAFTGDAISHQGQSETQAEQQRRPSADPTPGAIAPSAEIPDSGHRPRVRPPVPAGGKMPHAFESLGEHLYEHPAELLGEHLAEMINDALKAQARRHGMNLS